jgi:hypothetical protein
MILPIAQSSLGKIIWGQNHVSNTKASGDKEASVAALARVAVVNRFPRSDERSY